MSQPDKDTLPTNDLKKFRKEIDTIFDDAMRSKRLRIAPPSQENANEWPRNFQIVVKEEEKAQQLAQELEPLGAVTAQQNGKWVVEFNAAAALCYLPSSHPLRQSSPNTLENGDSIIAKVDTDKLARTYKLALAEQDRRSLITRSDKAPPDFSIRLPDINPIYSIGMAKDLQSLGCDAKDKAEQTLHWVSVPVADLEKLEPVPKEVSRHVLGIPLNDMIKQAITEKHFAWTHSAYPSGGEGLIIGAPASISAESEREKYLHHLRDKIIASSGLPPEYLPVYESSAHDQTVLQIRPDHAEAFKLFPEGIDAKNAAQKIPLRLGETGPLKSFVLPVGDGTITVSHLRGDSRDCNLSIKVEGDGENREENCTAVCQVVHTILNQAGIAHDVELMSDQGPIEITTVNAELRTNKTTELPKPQKPNAEKGDDGRTMVVALNLNEVIDAGPAFEMLSRKLPEVLEECQHSFAELRERGIAERTDTHEKRGRVWQDYHLKRNGPKKDKDEALREAIEQGLKDVGLPDATITRLVDPIFTRVRNHLVERGAAI